MFKDNKYTKWYFQILENAKNLPRIGYVEEHHIIPRSCGGPDAKDNLVNLSAREHFICHLLLTKMMTNEQFRIKMIFAASALAFWRNNDHDRSFKINSKHYESLKKELSLIRTGVSRSEETREKISEACKTHIQENGSIWAGRTHSKESKLKMSKAKIGKPGVRLGAKHSEETKKKMSKRMLGNTPWNKGKLASEKTKKKLSESHKGKPSWNKGKTFSDSTKKKMSEVQLGCKFIYNPTTKHQTRIKGEDPLPDGYVYGRLPKQIKNQTI